MSAKPVQLDQVPEKYDPVAMQRVLESAVRRLTDESGRSYVTTPPATPSTDPLDDPLEWVL